MTIRTIILTLLILSPMPLTADSISQKNGMLFFEKQFLNAPIMKPEMDSLQAKLDQHVYQIREGSIGGFDSVGGSCGCN